jgi:fibronectin type 3 domain-containing protein
VALTWNYAQGASAATGFRVSRAVNGGAFTLTRTINSVIIGANSFTDTNSVPGTLYTYQVVAFNATGSSAPATAAPVRTPLVAPTNLRVTFNGGRRIIIAWSLASAVNASNTRVYRSTDGVNFTPVATLPTVTLSYSNANLTVGQNYWYRVQAVNTTTGAQSAAVTIGPVGAR